MLTRFAALPLALFLAALPLQAQVVINEIFYHAPDDLTDLQWIELHNPTERAVNLAGWSFTEGVKFKFAAGATLAPRGYLVLCKKRELFQQFYETPVAGEFEKGLKRRGGRLELRNASGDLVDALDFEDHSPWPLSPAGWSASLERICPSAPSGLPQNWASSPLAEDSSKPAGTPGKPNAAYSAILPPVISDVSLRPPHVEPGQAITVEATVEDESGLREVTLRYRAASSGAEGEEKSLPMTLSAGKRYAATIPGQPAGRIVRARIQAVNQKSAQRFFPGENEPRPALSCLVWTNVALGKIPFGYIIHPDEAEYRNSQRQRRGPGRGRGGPFNEEDRVRVMAEMQFRSALDLPELWAALTLSNAPTAELEKLRSLFAQKSIERDRLEERTLGATNLPATLGAIPGVVRSFKTGLGGALAPLLTPEQTKVFEAWRDRVGAGGMFGFNPEMMLRQFVRLEPAYLYLATRSNLTTAQIVPLREVYRTAIQQRDALAAEARTMMSPDADREGFQAKLEAIEAGVEQKLKQTLPAGEAQRFAAWREQERPAFMRGPGGGSRASPPPRGKAAFVLVDPQTREPQLFDFVHVPERSGGWKVHFGKDQPLKGMTGINLIFEASDRWLLAEPLAYELHRRAGLAASLTEFVRLWVDGDLVGYHLLIEQPNKAFLRRNGLRDDGNLYKATWMGNGLVGQHEKKINPHTGHDDLIQLVEQLQRTKDNPAGQWDLIKREFEVEEVINHYAVRTLISDWDGFFNNYFLYHDLKGTKKWTFYPWDEDKTWGDHDGGGEGHLLYDMPLSFGAEGDKPPGWKGEKPPRGFMGPGMGGTPWWRGGGYISKPLLANPTFRQHFLARLRELLSSEFTAERLFPLVDQFRGRLQEEIQVSAAVQKEDPARALERFERNLASLKQHITKRRQWLLDQEEIKTAGAFDPAKLR